jgi:predicted nicotinamide N-methyase
VKSFSQLLAEHTIDDQVTIAGQVFFLKRISECDPLLDVISEAEFKEDERLPYWAELWPSALALAEYILENGPVFAGRSVLEIGCGLGLSGIAASRSGANVLFTDYDTYALEYTKENYLRNFNQPARVSIMDWRQPQLAEKFDLIIGSDVLYEKRWLEPVFNLLRTLLKADGEAIIAEPGRSVARDFFQMLQKEDCIYEKLPWPVKLENGMRQVDIYRIKIC